MTVNEEVIKNFRDATLLDISQGVPIEEIVYVLKEYEQRELYLECAGIKQALDFIEEALKNDC